MITFEFHRFRFWFRAVDPVHLPVGKASNAVRGAFGLALRETAPEAVYERLFDPRNSAGSRAPSGLGDWPRPFLFRAAHLDGQSILPGGPFFFDLHVFDVRQPLLPYFRNAFDVLAIQGIGARRGRAALERIEHLDLEDRADVVNHQPRLPSVISLDPDPEPTERVRVRFVTPTELKGAGVVAAQPEFPILFGRLRDRLSTLRTLYGAGPLEVDFRGLGERAALIRLDRCELVWDRVARKSGRTGQVHSIGGFTGKAEYSGPLAEFLPWLRAARWAGVGRQTVWGKGDLRVLA